MEKGWNRKWDKFNNPKLDATTSIDFSCRNHGGYKPQTAGNMLPFSDDELDDLMKSVHISSLQSSRSKVQERKAFKEINKKVVRHLLPIENPNE